MVTTIKDIPSLEISLSRDMLKNKPEKKEKAKNGQKDKKDRKGLKKSRVGTKILRES